MIKETRVDREIINGIKGTSNERDEMLSYIYEKQNWRNSVVTYVLRNGGTLDDGHEIAIRTLIAFDRNIRNNKFKENSSLKTYFIGIAKRQWFMYIRHNKNINTVELNTDVIVIDEDEYTDERLQLLRKILSLVGEKCENVIKLAELRLSKDEMANELGLRNAQMASKALLRCRKKIRALLDNNPHWWKMINR